LYMTKVFLFSDTAAYAMFAAFAALLFLTPLFGGWVADRFLGFRRSVLVGGVLLAVGYGLLGIPGRGMLFRLALGTIIVGNGFFKPNVSGVVGQLYGKNDPRRDGGFTIFYAGINIGSVIPPLVTGWIIIRFGWHPAFLVAASGVLVGTAIFFFGLRKRPELGAPPDTVRTRAERLGNYLLIGVGTPAAVYLFAELLRDTALTNVLLFVVGGLFLAYSFSRSFSYRDRRRERLIAVHILILFSIVFWALYQQGAMSLTIFTEFNVGREVGGWTIPTVMFQSVNPFFVILLVPFISRLWLRLERRGWNPSIPAKFALGTIFMGLGFVILPLAVAGAGAAGKTSLWWVVASYFLQTLGELFISPVGLSMITGLSPKKLVGMMMGVWFFATALANALAGFVSDWTALPSGTNNPLLTDRPFSHVFGIIGWIAVGVGVVFLFFAPILKGLIEGAKREK
ncbi:MAG TPA: peptide MFS transporter, partial [bacterium]|nr:peptide MFS transporter [bacterium]